MLRSLYDILIIGDEPKPWNLIDKGQKYHASRRVVRGSRKSTKQHLLVNSVTRGKSSNKAETGIHGGLRISG
jgi:hypothetical protein